MFQGKVNFLTGGKPRESIKDWSSEILEATVIVWMKETKFFALIKQGLLFMNITQAIIFAISFLVWLFAFIKIFFDHKTSKSYTNITRFLVRVAIFGAIKKNDSTLDKIWNHNINMNARIVYGTHYQQHHSIHVDKLPQISDLHVLKTQR